MLDSVGRQKAQERTRGFQASRTEWAVSSWEAGLAIAEGCCAAPGWGGEALLKERPLTGHGSGPCGHPGHGAPGAHGRPSSEPCAECPPPRGGSIYWTAGQLGPWSTPPHPSPVARQVLSPGEDSSCSPCLGFRFPTVGSQGCCEVLGEPASGQFAAPTSPTPSTLPQPPGPSFKSSIPGSCCSLGLAAPHLVNIYSSFKSSFLLP